ncbi:MAG: hypothetical protein ACLVLC_01460 [Finegoldia magna]
MNSSKSYHKNIYNKNYRKKKTLEDLRKDKANTKLSYDKSDNSQSNQVNINVLDKTKNRKESKKLLDKDIHEKRNDELEWIRVEIIDEFKHNDELKKAIIMKEIIDRPLCLRKRR